MMLQKIILCNNNIGIEIERLTKMKIKDIRCLSNKIIHSNPIFIGRINKKQIVIKFYKSKEIMQKEKFCNTYLKDKGLNVPEIISWNNSPEPFIIMNKINGKNLSNKDLSNRIRDLVRIQLGSLNESDSILKESLSRITKQDRLNNLKEYSEILKTNNLIEKNYLDYINILKKSISETNYGFWDDCFCFSDFFVNNSLKSTKGVYYFDFEKACISNPFIDVGCIIINYPEEYEEIKEEYIKNIHTNLKSENFKIELSKLSLLIDQGICEKVIEDAAFLSNDSIKKTKSNSYCKKLAKRKIESVSFVFDNLINSSLGDK